MAIVRYTDEELRQMPDFSDWERVKNMRDEDIDFSDIPEITDEEIARAYRPGLGETPPEPHTFYLKPSILSAFRKTGEGWQARINAAFETWLKQVAIV
ncbi:hypothetical protein AGMMS4956_15700 [Bacteroidia bacterium]|nr:hypothetical protein AGMMS4956_15700 [Bacteroidia bacterium]